MKDTGPSNGLMKPSRKYLLLCFLAAAAWARAVPAAEAPPDSARVVTDLPDLIVSSEAAAPPRTGLMILGPARIAQEDVGSLADLGKLLPSTRAAVNSRGEAVLMIRGAPERHVQTYLDGIPLNLPWDERVDLGSIPVVGPIRLEGRRGLASLLEGPGALAGSVRILASRPRPGPVSVTSAVLGEQGLSILNASTGGSAGPWRLQGGMSWRHRDAWPLPDGGPERFNSDLDQYSFLGRGSRSIGNNGRLNLLATGWHEEKGVPPELNLGDEARFWRYPERRRILGGASLDLPLGADGTWDLRAMTAVDFFTQEIDPRGPDGWGAPLAPGQDYEYDHDRTGHAMLGVTRWLAPDLRLTLQGNARYTNHRESLTAGGDELAYAQWLTALVAEGEWQTAGGWTLRGGAGWDHAATPQTGDKPDRPADDAEALNLRLERDLRAHTRIYLAASRRSRFPSLREMFSGALGKFLPNPDLHAERQDLIETGLTTRGRRGHLATAFFLQELHGGIEKEKLADGSGRFMRVNRTRIRVPGCEIIGTADLSPLLTVSVQHTFLGARVRQDGAFTGRAEDRPDYLSQASIAWRQPERGPDALLEALVTGPRWSADASGASDDTGGLQRLPAGVTWSLRLGYRWLTDGRSVSAHLRVDNIFDRNVPYQVGLPAPGRLITGGLSLEI